MRTKVVAVLIVAGVYEALPLGLAKASDLGTITDVDSKPRVEAIRLLLNPLLSTGSFE